MFNFRINQLTIKKNRKQDAHPNFAAVKEIAGIAIETIKKLARNNRDDLVGILYTSLNRYEHYPELSYEVKGVDDLTQNMVIDYSLYGREEHAVDIAA